MDAKFIWCLYHSKSVPEALDMYCRPMLNDTNVLKRLKAKRLLKYWGILTDYAFFDTRIATLFKELDEELKKEFPDLSYELLGRIKALISAMNKLDEIEETITEELKEKFIKNLATTDSKVIEEMVNSKEFEDFINAQHFEAEGKDPFSRVKDFFAFRIIIEDSDDSDHNQEAFDVANFLIKFLNNNSFQVVRSVPLLNTGQLRVSSPLIRVPEETGLKPENVNLCKDYITYPKSDGYQSLHLIVYDPYTDRYFEIQIRTRSMDIISETLANHDTYKQERYGKQRNATAESLDYSKITIDGFRYFKYKVPATGEEKEYISDKAGVIKSIPLKLEAESLLKKLQKNF